MRPDSIAGRIVAALARSTPAFSNESAAEESRSRHQPVKELVRALARNTPAFHSGYRASAGVKAASIPLEGISADEIRATMPESGWEVGDIPTEPPTSHDTAVSRPRLTTRERQVLQLAARGLTIAQIARELDISVSRAKTILAKAIAKSKEYLPRVEP